MQPGAAAEIDKDALKLVENEPSLIGYTDALKQMLDESKKRIDEISREKMPHEQGKEAACRDLAPRVLGLVHGVKELADAGNISGEEAMARRDLLVSACSVIESYAAAARKEYLHLQGEHRAVLRQIDSVSKMLTAKIAEEARKARSAAERERQREERALRAAEEQADAGAEPAQETTTEPEAVEPSPALQNAAEDAFGDEEQAAAEEPGPLPEPTPVIQIAARRRRTPKKR